MKVQQIVNKVNVDVARLVLVIAAAATAAREKNSSFLSFMFLPLSSYFWQWQTKIIMQVFARTRDSLLIDLAIRTISTHKWKGRERKDEGINQMPRAIEIFTSVRRHETKRNSEICAHEKRNEPPRFDCLNGRNAKKKTKNIVK